MEHGVGLPNFLQIGVISRKTMVWTSAAGIKQTHGIPFVTECGLDADKNVAEVASVDQKVGTVGVEIAWGLAPVLFKTA